MASTVSYYIDPSKLMCVVAYDEEIPQELIEKRRFERLDVTPISFESTQKVSVPRLGFWEFLLKNQLDSSTSASILKGLKSDTTVNSESSDLQNLNFKSKKECDEFKKQYKNNEEGITALYNSDFPPIWNGYISGLIGSALEFLTTSDVIELEDIDSEMLKIGAEGKKSFMYLSRCAYRLDYSSFNTIPQILQPSVLQMCGLPLAKIRKGTSFIRFILKDYKIGHEIITFLWVGQKEDEDNLSDEENVFNEQRITNACYLGVFSNEKPLIWTN